jgi:hypothetical protein
MTTKRLRCGTNSGIGASVVMAAVLLMVTVPVFAQDAPLAERVCGAGQAGANAMNLQDWAFCAAKDMVDKKISRGENPDIGAFFDPLAILAIAEGLNPQANTKVASLKFALVNAQLETKRTDKQLGASARAEGTTTLAEKAGIQGLLGLAIEDGAIQKEVNGTTLTLSTSPYVLSTLRNGDTAGNYLNHGDDLGRVGISTTFNIANQEDVLSNATRKQLAEWGVRIRLAGDHSPRSKQFQEFWEKNVKKQIEQEAVVITSAAATTFKGVAETRRRAVEDDLQGAVVNFVNQRNGQLTTNTSQVIAGLRDLILTTLKTEISDKVDSFGLDPLTRHNIVAVTMPALTDAHVQAREGLAKLEAEIQRLQTLGTATFEYTNVRDATTGSYSNLKFLYEKGSSDTMKVVFNIGGSFYSDPKRELNQQTTRDYATALSWEGIAGRSPLALDLNDQSQVTFSFSGRYQRLLENRHVAGKKADIASAQGKLELPILTGASLALSITYANADEMVSKDHVRFNFGINYDTGKLYQLLQVNKQKAALMQ